MTPEIGKCYADESGDTHGPMRPYGYCTQDQKGFAYLPDGRFLFPGMTGRNLVKEIECPKK